MDLGNSCLKRNGINLLTEAIHPRHGLAWSDGRSIYLSPVKVHSGQVDNTHQLTLTIFNPPTTRPGVERWTEHLSVTGQGPQWTAIHPRHGLAWSDGRSIYLSPVKVHSGQVDNTPSLKLGEFECIQSVHWGGVYELRWCYLCVVHGQGVSIWRVEGDVPKLSFKQVRKINASPISQGCLWNPSRDLLCIIGQHQCTFYYNHVTEKGSYAFPQLERGKFTCGAWNKDGTKLILAYGTVLLIYLWQDIDKLITQVQTDSWKVPGLDGRISAIVNMGLDAFVLSAELPLEQLVRVDNSFVMPDISTSPLSNDDVIRPSNSTSITDNLMNLQHKAPTIQDTSQTLVIEICQQGGITRVLARGSVKELLAPDLIMYDNQSQCIIVGSNAQCSLQIFRIIEQSIVKIGNIILDKEVRPKGLSPIPRLSQKYCTGCLVMLGRRADTDRTFLPSLQGVHYKLSLHFFSLPETEDARRKSVTRRRDASLQGRALRTPSPGPVYTETATSRKIRSASFIKSDYKTPIIQPVNAKSPSQHIVVKKTQNVMDKYNDSNNNISADKITKDKNVKKDDKRNASKPIPKSYSVDSLAKGGISLKGRSQSISHDLSHESVKVLQMTSRTPNQPQMFNNQQMDAEVSPPRLNDVKNSDMDRSFESWSSDASSHRSTMSEYDIPSAIRSVDSGIVTLGYRRKDAEIDDSESRIQGTKDADNIGNVSSDKDEYLSYSLEDIADKLDDRRSTLTKIRASDHKMIRNNPKRSSEYGHAIITRTDPVAPSRKKKLASDEDSSGSSTDLETSTVDFSDHPPKFAKNNLEKLDDSGLGEGLVHVKTGVHSFDVNRNVNKMERQSNVDETDTIKECVDKKLSNQTIQRMKKQDTLTESHSVASDVNSNVIGSEDLEESYLRNQQDQIEDLKDRIDRLTKLVEDTPCVYLSSYQTSLTPEVVHVAHTTTQGNVIRKTFLLDRGRLKLDAVQNAFQLDSVELLFEDTPIVIGSNIDGYIPFRFDPNTKWTVIGHKFEAKTFDKDTEKSNTATKSGKSESKMDLSDFEPDSEFLETFTEVQTEMEDGTACTAC